MSDIFKDAYFGKAYKTRAGKKALFVFAGSYGFRPYNLIIEGMGCEEFWFDENGRCGADSSESQMDIISEWIEDGANV